MCREGGERLLDGLLIADVRQHTLEHGDRTAVVSRNVQAAFRHQGQKAQCFQRDGLAAGIRAGDDEGVKIRSQTHSDGHDRFLVDQRVARAHQLDGRILADFRRHAVDAQGVLCLGKDHIQRDEHLIAVADALTEGRSLCGKLSQDPLDLLFLPDEQLAQGVVGIDRRHRLNEKRAARGGNVVDQAGNFGFVFTLDRHDITVAAQGDDGIAQVFSIRGRGNDLLQGFLDLSALNAHMTADVGQLTACGIRDLLLGENGICNFLLQITVG